MNLHLRALLLAASALIGCTQSGIETVCPSGKVALCSEPVDMLACCQEFKCADGRIRGCIEATAAECQARICERVIVIDAGVDASVDGSLPDASPPDGSVPDGSPPDADVPDAMPDADVPDAMPDADVPDAMPDGAVDGGDASM